MVDLEILESGKVVLNRNVLKGEIITYQNSYLKRINEIAKVEVLVDLNKNDILQSGHYSEGKIVILANENTDDYLVVKRQN
ncbi:hypothetical protein FDB39_17010 [Clostridium botulinum]|nr:hypothetical protein [Clostridium botulinum]